MRFAPVAGRPGGVMDTNKCAHPACNCTVQKGGPFGKYCSEHCKEARDIIELHCDCKHPGCSEVVARAS